MEAEREYGGYLAREIEAQWLKLPGGLIAHDLVRHVTQLLDEASVNQAQLQQQHQALYEAMKQVSQLSDRLDYLAREQYGEHAARCIKLAQQVPSFDNFCLLMWRAIDDRIERARETAIDRSAVP